VLARSCGCLRPPVNQYGDNMQSLSLSDKSDWISLIFFLIGCFAVAGLGSFATVPEIPVWYANLRKPAWTPPNWLFGPVWTALYLAMAIAAWMVWRRTGWEGSNGALWLFVIQLALNLSWSFIFFKFHSPPWAFVEIVVLWIMIAATIAKFAGISRASAILLAPYLVWVTYAAALNFAVWRMNK
jgi:translocator protein